MNMDGATANGKCLTASFLALTAFLGAITGHAQGTFERVKVHGEWLEGNLMGEAASPYVSIYVPPSYAADADRRYPVVYFLHGYAGSDLSYFGEDQGRQLHRIADRVFDDGSAREMILVMPNCDNAYRGCMYSNSATSGYWERYIGDELVAYVDARYRTIATRESRGLAGHSMGGYGAISLGMKRPDVFSTIYALSACCLADFSWMVGETARLIESTDPADVEFDYDTFDVFAFAALSTFARAAAWSPNPDNPPYYLDLPTEDGVARAEVAARWAANSPAALLASHVPYLKSLTAIMLDVGERDVLIESNREFSRAMDAYGIEHVFDTYEGDHDDRIPQRLENEVLPFFSRHLTFP